MAPNEQTIAELEALAERDPEALVPVEWLVRERFMRLADIDALRETGLRFYQVEDPEEGAVVVVGAREFLKAAARVADGRALDVVASLPPAYRTVH